MISESFELVNTRTKDKDAAMDWIEDEMKRQKRDLRAMEFDHTDDDGFHHFRVVAHPMPEQKMKAIDILRSA